MHRGEVAAVEVVADAGEGRSGPRRRVCQARDDGLGTRPRRRGVARRRAHPGAAEAVARLRRGRRGRRVLHQHLEPTRSPRSRRSWPGTGIAAEGEVLTSAMAAARRWSTPGERVLLCAGPGVAEASRPGAPRSSATAPPTRWSSGFHLDFDYDGLRASRRRGAGRRSADRHQRRPDLPDARRARSPAAERSWPPSPWLGGRARRGRQAVRADGGAGAGPARRRTAPWSATGPTPTGASPAASATASCWCSAGRPPSTDGADAGAGPRGARPRRRRSISCSVVDTGR